MVHLEVISGIHCKFFLRRPLNYIYNEQQEKNYKNYVRIHEGTRRGAFEVHYLRQRPAGSNVKCRFY